MDDLAAQLQVDLHNTYAFIDKLEKALLHAEVQRDNLRAENSKLAARVAELETLLRDKT